MLNVSERLETFPGDLYLQIAFYVHRKPNEIYKNATRISEKIYKVCRMYDQDIKNNI